MTAQIHVKYEGNTTDVGIDEIFSPEELLANNLTSETLTVDVLTDRQIKTQVGNHMDVSASEFDAYEVTRHENGNATIRKVVTKKAKPTRKLIKKVLTNPIPPNIEIPIVETKIKRVLIPNVTNKIRNSKNTPTSSPRRRLRKK